MKLSIYPLKEDFTRFKVELFFESEEDITDWREGLSDIISWEGMITNPRVSYHKPINQITQAIKTYIAGRR